MIEAFTSETTTWLGYLQRGSVLLQIALFVIAISVESSLKRKFNNKLLSSLTHLIVPGFLFIISTILTIAGVTAGYLQYLSLLWLIWRCVEPTKQLIVKRYPNVPVEEIDKSFFRPILLVLSIITCFQMVGSRESIIADFNRGYFRSHSHRWKTFYRLGDCYMLIAACQSSCGLCSMAWRELLWH